MGLGILSSHLGDDAPPTDAQLNAQYPWHVVSKDTLQLQLVTNQALQAAGYCPIPASGVLDGATCGARNHLTIHSREFFGNDMLFGNPPACKDPAHANELSVPTAGCFKPSTLKPGQPIGQKITKSEWIMIGGALSVLVAGFIALKGPKRA